MVVALSLVVGITDALSMPSFQTIVPSIVRRDQIGAGLALNATQFNLSRLLGPTLAGVLMASVGAIGCFAVNAASYLPFIGVALWILPRRSAPLSADESLDRHRIFSGLRDIAGASHIRGALLTVLATSMQCGPLIIFCPVLVKDVLHGDASEFSLAIGAFGVGGLLGAVGLLGVDAQRDRRLLSSRFAASYGAITALARNQSLVLGIAHLAGFCWPLDGCQQYFGKFPVASDRCHTAAWQNHQLVHARHARRDFNWEPDNRSIGTFAWSALRAIDQWPPGSGNAHHDRTTLDPYGSLHV
jgi:MFS family permease